MRSNIAFDAVALLVIVAAATQIRAQQVTATADDKAHADAQTLTGCLQKDHEGGFYLISDTGGTWIVKSKEANLAPNVGHTVSITGVVAHPNRRHQRQVSITHLQLVREGCQIDQPVDSESVN
jgi:hypothetical protein